MGLLTRLLPSKVVKEKQSVQKELEKAVAKRVAEMEKQCAMLDEINNKMMNWGK
jgi:hypothetical protein